VAQFTRNGLVFSRLAPYENWDQFEAEALRLWQVYQEVAEPSEIQRIGVRFINLIRLDQIEEVDDVLASPPAAPESMELPVREFLQQSRFDIPGHEYKLNVIQTIQRPGEQTEEGFALILDLDVFTSQTFGSTDDVLKRQLAEMRWIKNKAFFNFLTESAIARFKE
jgi:uncharacterized protein (TIGR04255 family)